jgi:hypothetical protein
MTHLSFVPAKAGIPLYSCSRRDAETQSLCNVVPTLRVSAAPREPAGISALAGMTSLEVRP